MTQRRALLDRGCRGVAALALGVCGAVAAHAAPARAHAPPLGARVLAAPDGSETVIVTNRGLIFRDARSGASRLLCNEALRITTAELPGVARLADGGLLVASSSGLRVTRDRGCSWADVGGMGTTSSPALASAPGDPDTALVASSTAERSRLLITRDGGRRWTTAFETEPGEYVHSLLVADPRGSHVYATLTTYGASESPVHWLLRSRDGGASWERRALPLEDEDYAAWVAAVNPSAPGELALFTIANSPGLDDARLLVSEDAGDRFEVSLERPEIRGADYDATGGLWVAARDGLYHRAASDAGFERVSTASELGCVSASGDAVLVCGHYAGVEGGPPGVGLSRDAGQSFETWLDFDEVQAPVDCDPSALTTTLCATPWRDWEAELLGMAATSAPDPYPTPGAMPGGDWLPSGPVEPSPAEASPTDAASPLAPGCAMSPARASARRSLLGALALSLALWWRARARDARPALRATR